MTREELIESILTEITNRTYRKIGRGVGAVAGGLAGGWGGLVSTMPLAFKAQPTTIDKATMYGVPGLAGGFGGTIGADVGEKFASRFGTDKEAETRRVEKPKVSKHRRKVASLIGASMPYVAGAAMYLQGKHEANKQPANQNFNTIQRLSKWQGRNK